jgi:hypothetical protein
LDEGKPPLARLGEGILSPARSGLKGGIPPSVNLGAIPIVIKVVVATKVIVKQLPSLLTSLYFAKDPLDK